MVIGSNSKNIIKKSEDDKYDEWKKIILNSNILAAACGSCFTLYRSQKFLTLQWEGKNNGDPFYIKAPSLSIFSGDQTAAVICSDSVILFSKEMITQVPPLAEVLKPIRCSIKIVKPVQIACLENSFIALFTDYALYEFTISNNDIQQFKLIPEVSSISFTYLSGTSNHCIAIAKDGRIYARGQNLYGQLGIGSNKDQGDNFVLLKPFTKNKIVAAFAGYRHSLFLDNQGAVFACGSNEYGELLFKDRSDTIVTSSLPTVITNGAALYIAGKNLSVVFIGQDPPPNSPNQQVNLKLTNIINMKDKSIVTNEDNKSQKTTKKRTNDKPDIFNLKQQKDINELKQKSNSKFSNVNKNDSMPDIENSIQGDLNDIRKSIHDQNMTLKKLMKENEKQIELIEQINLKVLNLLQGPSHQSKTKNDSDNDVQDENDYDED